jgi:ATP-dependent helicase/nuclease subunit A
VNGARHPSPVTLREIGAITYTNAAAADLKRKLRKALRDAGLRDAADEVDNARIGTIHSFCGDILREFALRAGRDPGARVLEDGEASTLTAEVVRDTVLDALERRSVAGLDQLFATYAVADVERWVATLVSESDRLRRALESEVPHGRFEGSVLQLADAALVRLSARLAEQGAIDFDRMITWTRDLLAQQPHVCRAVQRRLHTLIVDEFQDVDPVQREIAYLLGEPASGRADTTRLMLVGDPKQSIYRFRRADVTVWTGVEREFTERGWGGTVALDENFRSVAPILALVDATVGGVLDTPIDGEAHQDFEIRYAPVRATRLEPIAEPAVELLVVPANADGRGPNVGELREREAAAVARRARELHDAGTPLGSMALLLASWSSVETYETALRAAGLATYALRVDGFYECREVQDLLLALEAVRDPRDDRALFGWLRSPFVGVKDETLLELARSGPAPRFEQLAGAVTGEPALLAWAHRMLHEHAELRDRIPTAELLDSLLERTGYLGHLALRGAAGRQAIANVRKLVRMARQLPEQGVGDFLGMVRDARERGDKEGNARLFGEGDDVVTITSVHSAKGLEWPVVFWCDLSRAPRRGGDGTMLVGRDRIALKDPEAEQQSTQWVSLAAAEERESEAERKRLWYVAATRARDRLILGGFSAAKMDPKCPGAALWHSLGVADASDGTTIEYAGDNGEPCQALVHVLPPLGDDDDVVSSADAITLADDLPPLLARAGRPRYSATALMAYERCGRRHWFRYVAGLGEPSVDRTGAEYASGVARGQIVHDVLEVLEDGQAIDPLLEVAIGRWDEDAPTPEHPAGIRYRQGLKDEIEAVAGHPAYQALAAHPTARRELSFLYLAGAEAFVEGKMDLAARPAEGLVLLDVKTNRVGAEGVPALVEHYALQRDAYVTAAGAIGGEPVARFAFQFSSVGQQVSEPLTEERRASSRATLDGLLERIGSDAPALTEHAQDCNYCGYRTAGWCAGVGKETA